MPKSPTENSTRRTDSGLPDSAQRLFFALLPDAGVRERLIRLQKELEPAGGRPVPARNLHLTVLFLGDVEVECAEAVRRISAEAAGRRFDLVLDTFGGFGRNRARTLWVGPSELPPELGALHQLLRRQAKCDGLRIGKEAYRPHVTLVRKADPRQRVPEKPDRGIRWTARRLALLASELLPAGSRYRVLVEKDLSGDPR